MIFRKPCPVCGGRRKLSLKRGLCADCEWMVAEANQADALKQLTEKQAIELVYLENEVKALELEMGILQEDLSICKGERAKAWRLIKTLRPVR